MTRISSIGLLLFAAFGCALPIPQEIDSDFEPYIEQFVEKGRAQGVEVSSDNLTVVFADLSAPVVGRCWYATNPRKIEIDRKFWNASSTAIRENLFFHEMGHCVLDRGHIKDGSTLYPVSMMYPNLLYAPVYISNYEAYMRELFTLEQSPMRIDDSYELCIQVYKLHLYAYPPNPNNECE